MSLFPKKWSIPLRLVVCCLASTGISFWNSCKNSWVCKVDFKYVWATHYRHPTWWTWMKILWCLSVSYITSKMELLG